MPPIFHMYRRHVLCSLSALARHLETVALDGDHALNVRLAGRMQDSFNKLCAVIQRCLDSSGTLVEFATREAFAQGDAKTAEAQGDAKTAQGASPRRNVASQPGGGGGRALSRHRC